MSRGVNKMTLVGRIGADPELKYCPDGTAVATLSVATSSQWKDKDSGEKKERSEWHRVVLYNRLAEIASEHLTKGSQAYFEGPLRTRKWTDQNGVDRYTTEILALDMQMLGSKPSVSSEKNNNSLSENDQFSEAPQADSDQGLDDNIPY